jgi:hypothetical protein
VTVCGGSACTNCVSPRANSQGTIDFAGDTQYLKYLKRLVGLQRNETFFGIVVPSKKRQIVHPAELVHSAEQGNECD